MEVRMGKGSRYRPFNREKWDKAWEQLEKEKKEKLDGDVSEKIKK